MRNIVVGTAGHIDHGKTALVRALTGIDTDRLEEEKRRGISIDLGFAHLELTPEIRLGFIDVPGHERFVKNMLAGVGGIDLAMLVIAADESVKPQTREHFDICNLLGIRHGVVALTKIDLVDEDIRALATLEVEEFLAGSPLRGAPVVGVSAKTGEGLAELRATLGAVAAQVPARPAEGHFRLPVDRAFSIKGFGTVVTGTLISGEIAREEEVEVHPEGLLARVRGIEVYGCQVDRAVAGQRTALNLAGIEKAQLRRGMMLTRSRTFRPVREVECRVEVLATSKPIRNKAPVHFHAGSAEVEAEVHLFRGQKQIEPGGAAFARLVLSEPLQLLPGDRFILRRFSPVITIGGGVIADIAPPRYRRRDDVGGRLRELLEAPKETRLARLVREAPGGLAIAELVARTGWLPAAVAEAARKAPGVVFWADADWTVSTERIAGWRKRIAAALDRFHAANPLLPGLSREALRSQEMPEAPAFVFDKVLGMAPEFAAEGNLVRLASHKLVLKADEENARRQIEEAFETRGLTVPSVAEVLGACGVDTRRARNLLEILLKERRLVRVSAEMVFHASAIETLKRTIRQHAGEQMNVGTFKDWTGLSRKYAIPLLEYLDREHITRRVGDNRVVL